MKLRVYGILLGLVDFEAPENRNVGKLSCFYNSRNQNYSIRNFVFSGSKIECDNNDHYKNQCSCMKS